MTIFISRVVAGPATVDPSYYKRFVEDISLFLEKKVSGVRRPDGTLVDFCSDLFFSELESIRFQRIAPEERFFNIAQSGCNKQLFDWIRDWLYAEKIPLDIGHKGLTEILWPEVLAYLTLHDILITEGVCPSILDEAFEGESALYLA